jgi:predicted enzyme related to lactoylglutathione lyase
MMNSRLTAVVYPTSDLAKAKAMLSRVLGGDPTYDDPYYVGFDVGGLQIGLDPNGEDRGMTGATPMFEVDDIHETVAALKAAGATVVEDVRSVGGGNLIAMVSDDDGNMIGLGQAP